MRAWLTIFMSLACLALAQVASAQSLVPTQTDTASDLPEIEGPLTEAQAQSMLSRLSDEQVREILLQQLGTATEAQTEHATSLSDFLYHATVGASTSITGAIERLPVLFTRQGEAFATFVERQGGTSGLMMFALLMGVSIAGGLLAEIGFRRITRNMHQLPKNPSEEMSLRQTMGFLIQRLCTEVVAVVIFVLVARLIGGAIMTPRMGEVGADQARLMTAIGRFFSAPNNPAYRIVHSDDRTARAMVFHMFWFGMLLGLSLMIVQFNEIHGVPMGETRLGFWLNFAVHLYVAIVCWRYRDGLVMMMRGKDDDVTPTEERIARLYPYFGIIVAMGIWWVVNIVASFELFGMLGSAPHYKTMALLLFAPAMDTAIRGLVRHLVPPMTGEGPLAERAWQSTKRSYTRIGRVIVFACVLITIAGFWGMTPQSLASAGVGERVAAALLEFLMILSVGYLLYELVSLYINRKLAAEQTAAGYDPDAEEIGGEGGGAGGSRLSTVLPLVLAVSRAGIVVIFLLLGLSHVGIDTTPLLAGAGIVGLAIGFGAQKLVTDVVSGIFFLIDDAFRTGEYVEVDGTMGTVEKISIRSMQLRHHKGPVHTIPYGEIPKITNYSRDWVIMKLRFTVPFGTDPNKVKKIFKRIGAEMLEEELFKEDFLQPFKSQGVLEFDDVGMVIRGKFMAKPGKQFTLRKEIFNRVNKAFEENGIDFARREVRVAIPNLDTHKDLTEEDRATIAAAASQAAQDMAEETASAAPKPGD